MAKANKGSFKKGFDPRRKLFSQDDRRRGYANAPSRIKARIRGMYKGGKIKKTGETVYAEYETMDDSNLSF